MSSMKSTRDEEYYFTQRKGVGPANNPHEKSHCRDNSHLLHRIIDRFPQIYKCTIKDKNLIF